MDNDIRRTGLGNHPIATVNRIDTLSVVFEHVQS